jgi:phospholipid/cholesterol/gamma-HCH transport system substrate-binding protein
MTTRSLEITVGSFMAVGIIALFFLALQVSNLSTMGNGETYDIRARFDNIGSLKVKAPVSMAGVRIGRVSNIQFDNGVYNAIVTLSVEKQYNRIPDDTIAKIYTAGLLGEQYVGLEPGGSEVFLGESGEIIMTQSAMVLEDMISQFLFNKAAEGVEGEKSNE